MVFVFFFKRFLSSNKYHFLKKCGSMNTIKNGSIHNGKPKCQCNECGRQFVIDPQESSVHQWKKDIIDRLLLEKIPLAGIARAIGVSESWLQDYVNKKYDAVPRVINVRTKKKGQLVIQCDEMWCWKKR